MCSCRLNLLSDDSGLIVLILLFSLGLRAQPEPVAFERMSQEQFGFAEMDVYDIIQDQEGFIWLATRKGLFRHDGHELRAFRENPNDPKSLSDNNIKALSEGADGTLWAGASNGGLSRYDKYREEFTHYRHDPADSTSLSSDEIEAILVDSRGRLWIGTRAGLDRLDSRSEAFIHYRHRPGDPHSLGSNDVNCLEEDNRGRIWVGTQGGGVNCLDPATGRVERLTTASALSRRISHDDIPAIALAPDGFLWASSGEPKLDRIDPNTFEVRTFSPFGEGAEYGFSSVFWDIRPGRDGALWLGTHADGLVHYAPETGAVTHYRQDPASSTSIAADIIFCLLLDNRGDLWIGHGGPGWSRLSTNPTGYDIIPISIRKEGSLPFPAFRCVTEDERGHIWAGTWGNGLLHYDPNTGQTTSFLQEAGGLAHNIVWDILRDREGFLWLATHGGLQRLDPRQKTFRAYPLASGKPAPAIRSVLEGRSGKLWVGSFEGLYELAPGEESLRFSEEIPNGPAYLVAELFEDSQGYLWASILNQGLYRKNLLNGDVVFFQKEQNNPQGLTSNYISSIVEDEEQRVWLGTVGGGLNLFIPNSDIPRASAFKHWRPYSTPLLDENILNISVGSKNRLWLTTDSGLLSFGPKEGTVMPHVLAGRIKGLNVETRPGAGGYLYVGNAQYLYRFHPDSILSNTHIPPVFITGLQIGGRPAPVQASFGDSLPAPSPLEQSILYTSSLELKHWQNDLTFTFTALNYFQPENNRYRFQLKGFDDQPVEVDASRRYVRYTNLPPGPYEFWVAASNNANIWNEEGKTLLIYIHPPWWRTGWAYLLWAGLIAGILYFIYSFQLQRKLALAENRRLQELERFKARLYTNITHEFRTPLTLILGAIEQLDEKSGESIRKSRELIGRQGRHLLKLVNQLLGLSKLESGNMRLNEVQADIIPFIQAFAASFESAATFKGLQMSLQFHIDSLYMDFDPEKLQAILANLLSNAIKFTPEGGRVRLTVSKDQRPVDRVRATAGSPDTLLPLPCLFLAVTDTGPGISQDELSRIFGRFYQVDSSSTREGEGSGIGLALARELANLMDGDIEVTSQPGKGSTFMVRLPIRQSAPRQEVIPLPEEPFEVMEEAQLESQPLFESTEGKGQPLALVVEDNPEMAQFVTGLLREQFRVITAANGAEGIKKALKWGPAAIISDVMMPKMDGFELCRRLKQDDRTSHIPIVLLTARADEDSRIEGLEYGADAYLSKPFSRRELLVRMEQLVALRRRLRERFGNLQALPPEADSLYGREREFIMRVQAIIHNYLSDNRFDLHALCRELGMARTPLHNKLKALTGRSTTHYIRAVRLQQARKLLLQTDLTVSEIAYRTGFNNPNYFSSSFKEEFGLSPSRFRKKEQ